MGQPLAVCDTHVGEAGGEGGVLRGAGVDAEADGAAALVQVADAHLAEVEPVLGALDAVIVLTAAASRNFVGNVDPLRSDGPVFHNCHHHGDLLVEAPGAAGAGIEPQQARLFLLHIFVGVAEYHHIHPCEVRRDLFLLCTR